MAHYLIIFGFAWILVASIMGMVIGTSRENKIAELQQLAAEGKLADFVEKDWNYRWSKSRHAHAILFSILCVVVGFALELAAPGSPTLATIVAALMIGAVVIWTLAAIGHIVPVMGVADLMLFSGVLLTGWIMYVELPTHDHSAIQIKANPVYSEPRSLN